MGVPNARGGPLPVAGTAELALRCTSTASSLEQRDRGCWLTLACVLGCASGPTPPAGRTAGSREPVYLILPLNVAAVMPSELESYERDHLGGARALSARGTDKRSRRWTPTSRASSGSEASNGCEPAQGARAGFDDAARVLAVELRSNAEFDAMIAPSLYIREARSRTARRAGTVSSARSSSRRAGPAIRGSRRCRSRAWRLRPRYTSPCPTRTATRSTRPREELRAARARAPGR